MSSNFFIIGNIIHKHGLNDFLEVRLNYNIDFKKDKINFIYIDINGLKVPFLIKEIKSFIKNKILIKLYNDISGIDIKNKSLFLLVKKYFFLKNYYLNFNKNSIIGYNVNDLFKGYIGVLISINKTEYQEYFNIFFKKKYILVPLVKEFIINIDNKKRLLLLNCPNGLIDLYIF